MLQVKNTEVFGLERALKAAKNPMSVGEINTAEKDLDENDFKRGIRLGKTPVGSAHDHYLVGITVQADILYPSYWTIEAERYHNFEIISSQSSMHRLTIMGKDDDFFSMFNKYVEPEIISYVQRLIKEYNEVDSSNENAKYVQFMRCISNLPRGFEMWMTVNLSYLQIKTMYLQRRNHKLKEDWGAFCDWCESLPHFMELCGIVKE